MVKRIQHFYILPKRFNVLNSNESLNMNYMKLSVFGTIIKVLPIGRICNIFSVGRLSMIMENFKAVDGESKKQIDGRENKQGFNCFELQ